MEMDRWIALSTQTGYVMLGWMVYKMFEDVIQDVECRLECVQEESRAFFYLVLALGVSGLADPARYTMGRSSSRKVIPRTV